MFVEATIVVSMYGVISFVSPTHVQYIIENKGEALVKKRVQLVRTVETFRYTSESSFVHEVEQVLSESHSLSALDAMEQSQMFILNSHKGTRRTNTN